MGKKKMISDAGDIARVVNRQGFLPFFASDIPDFSLEEITPPQLWFPDDEKDFMGVWDWKSDVIIEGDCAYGKFVMNKACFISMKCFPHFINYRRGSAHLNEAEKTMLGVLAEHHSLLSGELKKLCGYVDPPRKRIGNRIERAVVQANRDVLSKQDKRSRLKSEFERAITRLQMAGYVVIADFEYKHDRYGKRYGWGMARYCTAEDFFGAERLEVNCPPNESGEWLLEYLSQKLPHLSQAEIMKVIG